MAKSKAPAGEAEAASSVSGARVRAATLLTEPTPNAAHRGASERVTVDRLAELARRHLSEDERRELAKLLVAELPKRMANRPPGSDTFERLGLLAAFVHRQAASVATTGKRLPDETAAREVVEHYQRLWSAGHVVSWGNKGQMLGTAEEGRSQTRSVIRAYRRNAPAHDEWIAMVATSIGAAAWPYPPPL